MKKIHGKNEDYTCLKINHHEYFNLQEVTVKGKVILTYLASQSVQLLLSTGLKYGSECLNEQHKWREEKAVSLTVWLENHRETDS